MQLTKFVFEEEEIPQEITKNKALCQQISFIGFL